MNKVDTEVVKFALSTSPSKSDTEIATLAGVLPADVTALRASLGLTKPQGTETLKQYAARYLLEMTESEKKEFIKKLPEEMVWKMAEGSPATTGEIKVNQEPVRIDITHQLLKVYGPRVIDQVPGDGEAGRLPAGSSGQLP